MSTGGCGAVHPLIDVSSLRQGDVPAMMATAAALGRAARSSGFLYVTGHGIPAELFQGLVEAAKGFFAQPLTRKMQVYIGNSRNHRGYVPEGEEVFAGGSKDAKESYDCAIDLPAEDPDYLAGNPLLGPNQWPDLPGFRAAVSAYYAATFELGRVLMRGFALALGEEPTMFEPMLTKPPSQLRMIHYPHDATGQDRPGIGAHTDYECFTLLRSTAPGLEVLDAEGTWLDAPPLDDAYVVNIGDMLELWTNGEFVATSHRVRRVQQERYSFPLFFAVDYQTRIAPLPNFVSRGTAVRTPLVAGEHLFAQTARTFGYLKQRLQRGELRLPAPPLESAGFGQQVRLGRRRNGDLR
jgi:isopenicillin N synthase-like dioxygenase